MNWDQSTCLFLLLVSNFSSSALLYDMFISNGIDATASETSEGRASSENMLSSVLRRVTRPILNQGLIMA